MKVSEIIDLLNAELLTGNENLNLEINAAFGSDLMSDVMAYVKESLLLLTGLVSLQVVRTAEMMDIKVILCVSGKIPGDNIISLAREKGITIASTKHSMFISCGKLYSGGITEKGVWD